MPPLALAAAIALTIDAFLTGTCNLTIAAATAVQDQGLQAYNDFKDLTDKDITGVCEKARSPGGTVARGGGGRQANEMVADRGVKVGFIQEKNLRQARFFIFHHHRIQRPFNPDTTTLEQMRDLWNSRFELEKEGTKSESNSDDIKPLKKEEDVRTTLEDLDNVLLNKLGAGGSPLAYVTRKDVALPESNTLPDEEDPGAGLPSLQEELIRRTRHEGTHYATDNQAVWNIIRSFTHGGPAWNWVSTHSRQRDGRAAYLDLKKHYLGSSFVAKTISDATADLKTIYFNGRSKNFSFEAFCGKLNKAFTDLLDNGQEYTEMMKVHTLLEAIQDPLMEQAKLMVLSDNKLMNNYTETIAYLKVALNSYTNKLKSSSHRNISVLNTGGRGGGRGSFKGGRGRGRGRGRGGRGGRDGRGGGRGGRSAFDPSNPAKSLSNAEWATLLPEEKEKAREARQKKRNVSAMDVDDDEEDEKEEGQPQDHFRPGDQVTRRNKKKKV